MRCPLCPGAVAKLKPNNQAGKFHEKFNCKACGFPIGSVKEFYSCHACKGYNLCVNCKVCRKGHPLTKVYSLAEMGPGCYKKNEYYCDEFSGHVKVENYVYHCRPCGFDLCDKCCI